MSPAQAPLEVLQFERCSRELQWKDTQGDEKSTFVEKFAFIAWISSPNYLDC